MKIQDKISGVYAITNLSNGHRYIGSSIDIYRRWSQHRRQLRKGTHSNQILQRAWDKYSEDTFEFSILIVCSEHDTLLNEQRFLDTVKPEYNIAVCAEAPSRGLHFSEEHRRNISKARKGYIMSDEQKQKLSEAHKGKKHTEEWKAKMCGRTGTTGYKYTDEQKEHLRQSHLGYVMPEEQKAKISAGLRRHHGKTEQ